MLFVDVISVQLAASGSYKQNSVWAKIFIDSIWELPLIFFAQKQLHFVLLAALKAINTSLSKLRIYSIAFMNEISTPMSKFVLC